MEGIGKEHFLILSHLASLLYENDSAEEVRLRADVPLPEALTFFTSIGSANIE